jgi:hypothetical protein
VILDFLASHYCIVPFALAYKACIYSWIFNYFSVGHVVLDAYNTSVFPSLGHFSTRVAVTRWIIGLPHPLN